ncbi:ATP-binding protein [Domibacillus robiginosus]|uniref:ATP-binding protein n=1 Tax=Domibacillus robiginosus TaxID=1071054 RepID=UPI00067D7F84|nr:ATP-binding protein [Domibacillus robiginosus]
MKQNNICFDTLKKECATRGLDPASIPSFKHILDTEALTARQRKHAEFIGAVTYFFDKFIASLPGIPVLATATDKHGYVLHMIGDSGIKEMVAKLGIRNGVQMTKEYNGINSACLALDYQQPVGIVGSQHYHHYLYHAACYSIPIRNRTHSEEIVGTLSFMTAAGFAHPLFLSLLMTMKESIERELQLMKQNETLRLLNELIMDTTTSGMIISDKEGNIINVNEAAEQMMKQDKQSLLSKTAADCPFVGDYLERALSEGLPSTDIERTFKSTSERETTYLLDALPIFDQTEKLVGAFAQLRDITQRKETEQMLLNTEKLAAVGQMAASAAHEIRNPLTTIRGFIQLLQPSFSDQGHFNLVLEEIDRINLIISEFLILSKPQATCFGNQNLIQILHDTIALSQPQASMGNVQIVKHFYDSSDLFIHGDGNQLKQVFINLFKNGMDAMPDGGTLSVDVYANLHGEAVAVVSDKGAGMTDEQLGQLGNPFYTTKKDGTGLGFMIIQRILKQHGGSIDVQSRKGEGTTITLRFPIKQEETIEQT